tara:strand:+ start:62145 stop:63110 length:966 start_codon:yes stop_codon:yes gene_type:complete
MKSDSIIDQFALDVDKGLSEKPKNLSSKYFYDVKGDQIFQQIMRMPEYYLTRSEFEIFESQKQEILDSIRGEKFNLVELGAGDGLKTKILIEHFLKEKVEFEYFPIDISADVLEQLKKDLSKNFLELKVNCLNYEYFKALEKLNEMDSSPKVLLFLGGNIGNFSNQQALSFYSQLAQILNPKDSLISGIDLKKNPRIILEAYNDKAGITRAFNMNLLERMNRELGANFIISQFDHYPSYDPKTGEAQSYIVSKMDQSVEIKSLAKTFHFEAWETIQVEISKKYHPEEISELAQKSGFEMIKNFSDSKSYFVDSLWRRKTSP